VLPLSLPPLRERREDIPLLIDHFMEKFCKQYKRKICHMRPDVVEMLRSAPWKGNIRELANILERAVLLSENNVITMDCLLQEGFALRSGEVEGRRVVPLRQTVEEAEKRAILRALSDQRNNRTEAARALGISRRALYDKMAAYRIGTAAETPAADDAHPDL
jgi:two-component system, NtrC family, response regulator AtoC